MLIPVAVGLVSDNGNDMDMGGGETTKIFYLEKDKQDFVVENVSSAPVPSVLRNFSAPVKLKSKVTEPELSFLMVHDSDGFNRWEAGQEFGLRTIDSMLQDSGAHVPHFVQSYSEVLQQALRQDADKAFFARAFSLPDVSYIGQHRKEIDPPAIYAAREKLLQEILAKYRDVLTDIYNKNRTGKEFLLTAAAMGQRALQNTVLRLLTANKDEAAAKLAKAQYDTANNMTDRVAALSVLAQTDSELRDQAFVDFYHRFKNYQLVVDKWFALQASAVRVDTLQSLKALRTHPEFTLKNPNRARSLYASFAINNPVIFHAANGNGYDFLTDAVIELNSINPQIASRLLTPMREWKRYTQDRQTKMRESLQRILDTPKLSPDVFEIASKSIKN